MYLQVYARGPPGTECGVEANTCLVYTLSALI
jgi:hypothetical protein